MAMNQSRPAIQIWAHRGASTLAPENTLPAFELAVREQADGIELDVQLTADGIAVVTHDSDCRRLAGVPGLVGQMTLAELKQLNFASSWPMAGTVRLPALSEVFDLIRPTRLMINVELKNDEVAYPGLEEEVLLLAGRHGMLERILLSSFNRASVAHASRLIRERGLLVACGLIYGRRLDKPWVLARDLGAQAIHPAYRLVRTQRDVLDAHAAGIRIHPWTLDDAVQLEQAMRFGVDAVITNVPSLARQVLDRLTPAKPAHF
jgi:glycerophosphoryl diester phosphodiesterase